MEEVVQAQIPSKVSLTMSLTQFNSLSSPPLRLSVLTLSQQCDHRLERAKPRGM